VDCLCFSTKGILVVDDIPKKLVGYTRVSTAEQADAGSSIEKQTIDIRAYANARDLGEVEILSELGVSGGMPLHKRPVGSQLVARITDGEVHGVIAAKLDRLFRNSRDCLNATGDWKASGVVLHLLDISLDTNSPMGEGMLGMMAVFGQIERRLIQARVKSGMDLVASQGYQLGGLRYGQQYSGDQDEHGRNAIVPNDQAQKISEWMLDLYGEGKSLRAIAATLNKAGISSPRGKKWFAPTVGRVIKREMSRGGDTNEN